MSGFIYFLSLRAFGFIFHWFILFPEIITRDTNVIDCGQVYLSKRISLCNKHFVGHTKKETVSESGIDQGGASRING